jgi:GTPase
MVNTIKSVKVLDPESQRGSVEYKRQIIDPTPTRLRTLATQMSFRIDEGKGTAIYQIGVEDDGSHSLLDFDVIEKSVNALELLARSLNAIVIEKTFYQGEVVTQQCLEGQQQSNMKHNGHPVVIQETITTNASLTLSMLNIDVNGSSSDKEEKYDSCLNENVKSPCVSTFTKINTNKGIPTRCKMTLQRIETHLLDPTPKSLSDIANFASQCTIEPSSTSKNTFPTTDTTIPSSAISISDTLSLRNIRVAVVGNVDAGKSTLIGTLTTSSLDDGRGRSRTSIMKHRHEIESGRTSTATTHLMGFKSNGQPIAGRDFVKAPNKTKSEDEIARESFRVVTFMDLAGHEKYLKTTIHGVSSGFADYALIMVNSRHPPTHMTQHHINLCSSFGIPLIIVFTKVDGCPDHALKTS